MRGVKALVRIRVENAGLGQPVVKPLLQPLPARSGDAIVISGEKLFAVSGMLLGISVFSNKNYVPRFLPDRRL
jgi:hypothetical protein